MKASPTQLEGTLLSHITAADLIAHVQAP